MPTYVYLCRKCRHQFEAFQKITEEPIKDCDECHSQAVERLPSAGLPPQFQGTGFYCTDYSTKPKDTTEGSCNKPEGCGCH